MADSSEPGYQKLEEEGVPTGMNPPPYSASPPGFTGQPGHVNSGYAQPVATAPHQIHVAVPPIGPDELPPPYTPNSQGGPLMINCKVCQNAVSIQGKQSQHVVKCQVCNEATPIKAPPPGKKYVRCPCNCLLICRAPAQKIACPRPNCKRILNMAGNGLIGNVTVRTPGTNRVQCCYCNNNFLFAVVRTPLARCPHCRRVSSVTPDFVKCRVIIYLFLGFVFLGAGIGVTVGTYEVAQDSGGIYSVWIGAFIMGILFLIRGCYFSSVRTSQIIGPAP